MRDQRQQFISGLMRGSSRVGFATIAQALSVTDIPFFGRRCGRGVDAKVLIS